MASDSDRLSVSSDPLSLSRILLYGSAETRRSLADEVRGSADARSMLAETVRSREPWRLRARSLEVLGMAAAGAERSIAESILAALLGAEERS